MPERFVFPFVKVFNGTSDLDNHVAHYKQNMFVVSIPRTQCEACMCNGFGSSISGPALQWHTSIPNALIGSFAEQFSSSYKAEKLPNDLNSIRQRKLKPFRSFVARFNKEKVSIQDAP